jgi:uncharacterized protein YjiS (DUF1127 family)
VNRDRHHKFPRQPPYFPARKKCTLVLPITSAAAATAYTLGMVRTTLRETAMSATKANSLRAWFKHHLPAWDSSSFEAATLSDSILRDIGLSRSERFKPAMPFWLP